MTKIYLRARLADGTYEGVVPDREAPTRNNKGQHIELTNDWQIWLNYLNSLPVLYIISKEYGDKNGIGWLKGEWEKRCEVFSFGKWVAADEYNRAGNYNRRIVLVEKCNHDGLIDTGTGYYHCGQCNRRWTYEEWAHRSPGTSQPPNKESDEVKYKYEGLDENENWHPITESSYYITKPSRRRKLPVYNHFNDYIDPETVYPNKGQEELIKGNYTPRERALVFGALMSGFQYGHGDKYPIPFIDRMTNGEYDKLCKLWNTDSVSGNIPIEGKEVWQLAEGVVKRLIDLMPSHINPYNLGDEGEVKNLISTLGQLFKQQPTKP